jgi:hypothetical protein
MQTPALDQPGIEIESRLGAQGSDEAGELALLAQFMRHDSVVSLASAIAERLGGPIHGGDLIAAAGLCARRKDRCAAPSAQGQPG